MRVAPKNASELYAYLQQTFGVGTYDVDDAKPYWEYQRGEAMKINAMCRKRRTSVPELFRAAEYCASKRIHIQAAWELLQYIATANRAARPERNADLAAQLTAAVDEANRLNMPDWASRLYMTIPSAAAPVLAEFEAVKKELSHG